MCVFKDADAVKDFPHELQNIRTPAALVSQTAIKSFGATGQDLGIGLKSKFDPKLVA